MTRLPIGQHGDADKSSGLQQYIKFRNWLLREIPKINPQILRPSERVVFRVIVGKWLAAGHNVRSINVTVPALMRLCGLSKRSIISALRRLEFLDLIFPSLDRELSGIGSDLFVNIRNVASFIDACKNGDVDDGILRPRNGGSRVPQKDDDTPQNLVTQTGANLPVQNRCKSAPSAIYKERARLIIDIQPTKSEVENRSAGGKRQRLSPTKDKLSGRGLQ